jgi:hypothetical protein
MLNGRVAQKNLAVHRPGGRFYGTHCPNVLSVMVTKNDRSVDVPEILSSEFSIVRALWPLPQADRSPEKGFSACQIRMRLPLR